MDIRCFFLGETGAPLPFACCILGTHWGNVYGCLRTDESARVVACRRTNAILGKKVPFSAYLLVDEQLTRQKSEPERSGRVAPLFISSIPLLRITPFFLSSPRRNLTYLIKVGFYRNLTLIKVGFYQIICNTCLRSTIFGSITRFSRYIEYYCVFTFFSRIYLILEKQTMNTRSRF